jgi:hypothetical protein
MKCSKAECVTQYIAKQLAGAVRAARVSESELESSAVLVTRSDSFT